MNNVSKTSVVRVRIPFESISWTNVLKKKKKIQRSRRIKENRLLINNINKIGAAQVGRQIWTVWSDSLSKSKAFF